MPVNSTQPTKRSINSRAKGKRCELEACKKIMEHIGGKARRSVQYCGRMYDGAGGSADILWDDRVHIEVKANEQLNIDVALDQAKNDAREGQIPLVLHKKNKKPWKVTVDLVDILSLSKIISEYTPKTSNSQD